MVHGSFVEIRTDKCSIKLKPVHKEVSRSAGGLLITNQVKCQI